LDMCGSLLKNFCSDLLNPTRDGALDCASAIGAVNFLGFWFSWLKPHTYFSFVMTRSLAAVGVTVNCVHRKALVALALRAIIPVLEHLIAESGHVFFFLFNDALCFPVRSAAKVPVLFVGILSKAALRRLVTDFKVYILWTRHVDNSGAMSNFTGISASCKLLCKCHT
jgi:hypothetical protein